MAVAIDQDQEKAGDFTIFFIISITLCDEMLFLAKISIDVKKQNEQ
ncbi:hypothetical protein JKF56_14645 [Klebsiella pneumoniae]|nr:hypothetical protein [Klebsiella pneumoniae]QWA81962.1 hypothetical protein JKF56_14645 [Klebsiella pneumoniae]